MDIIITDVTDMRGGHVCVAGWCPAEGRMVRPLSGPGQHWVAAQAGAHLFQLGNVVRVAPTGAVDRRGPPHSLEDILVTTPHVVGQVAEPDLPAALQASEFATMEELFRGCLQDKRIVPAGSDCPSLGAVTVNSRQMGFDIRKRNGQSRLRCWFYDASDTNYNLPVASRALLALFADSGLQAVQDLRGQRRRAHVRIGLAHPFDDGACYAMVNNILFH